jgi:uncharacterized protein
MRVRRPELIARDGYDSKYAMHLCRLGYQGLEFVQTGKLTLPMEEPARSWLYALRQGQIPREEMLARATEIEDALRAAIDTSPLPEEPDQAAVERWMLPRLGRGRPALSAVAPACRFGYDPPSARSRARLAQW